MSITQTQSTASVTVSQRQRGLVAPGLTAAACAVVGTTVVAALAMALGVDFEMPDGGEAIPLFGFALPVFVFSVLGVGIAAGARRWSRRPAVSFVRVTVSLTVVSLVPPFLVDANLATSLALVVLHLVAAAIVIPVLARRLDG